MNKKELAKKVAKKTGMSVTDTLLTLNTALDMIKGALYEKEKVQLVGFGTFEVRQRIERVGKSPQDPQKEIVIPAKDVPYFKPGSELKDGVNAVKAPAKTEKTKSSPKKEEKVTVKKAASSEKAPAKKSKKQ